MPLHDAAQTTQGYSLHAVPPALDVSLSDREPPHQQHSSRRHKFSIHRLTRKLHQPRKVGRQAAPGAYGCGRIYPHPPLVDENDRIRFYSAECAALARSLPDRKDIGEQELLATLEVTKPRVSILRRTAHSLAGNGGLRRAISCRRMGNPTFHIRFAPANLHSFIAIC